MRAIKELFKRIVAIPPVIIKATGSAKLAILWCQISYWSDKTKDPDGWVYKTQNEIFDECGLSRREQEKAREIGWKLGVLESEVKGHPPKVHYRINEEIMIQLIEKYLSDSGDKIERKTKPENSLDWARSLSDEECSQMAMTMSVSESTVKNVAQDLVDYCEAKGKTYKNYRAALRNFIKGHLERHPDLRVSRPTKEQVEMNEHIRKSDERSPEEQARINASLKKARESLGKKFAM